MWGKPLQVVTAAAGLFQEDLVKFFVANGVQIRATAHEMSARLGGVFSTGVRVSKDDCQTGGCLQYRGQGE